MTKLINTSVKEAPKKISKKERLQKILKDNVALLTDKLYFVSPSKYYRINSRCVRIAKKINKIEEIERTKGLTKSEKLRSKADSIEKFCNNSHIGYRYYPEEREKALEKVQRWRKRADRIDRKKETYRMISYGTNYNNLYKEAQATKQGLKDQNQIDEIDLQLEEIEDTQMRLNIHQTIYLVGQIGILAHYYVVRKPMPIKTVAIPMILSVLTYLGHLKPMNESFVKNVDDTRLLISNLRARSNIKPLVVNSDEAVRIRNHQMNKFAWMQGTAYKEGFKSKIKSR